MTMNVYNPIVLTIAIPNYNGAPFLEDTVRSYRNVNLPASMVEILVIDNCSTDNSVAIIKRLQSEEFDNIRLVCNKTNAGRLGNWKKCIEMARGKYITFLFVTNHFYGNYDFKNVIPLLESQNNISMVISAMIAKKNATSESTANFFYDQPRQIPSQVFIEETLGRGKEVPGYLQAGVMRVEDLRHIAFDEAHPFTADQIFMCQAILMRPLVYITPNPSVVWNLYLNPNRFTANSKIETVMSNLLYAANCQARMIGKDTGFLTRFYATQLFNTIDHYLTSRNILSKQSNYPATFKMILDDAGNVGINRLEMLLMLTLHTLKRGFFLIYKKLFKRFHQFT